MYAHKVHSELEHCKPIAKTFVPVRLRCCRFLSANCHLLLLSNGHFPNKSANESPIGGSMKMFSASLLVMALSSSVWASFPPRTTCSNEGGTIEIDVTDRQLTIVTSKLPSVETVKFELSDLNLRESTLQRLPEEKYGCTSRKVEFKHITLTKRDGSAMPHAYNRLARKDGSLPDYFICATNHAWMPAPGQSCE
jgi:hypothetical protein